MTRAAWAEAAEQLKRDGKHELASNLEQEIYELHQRGWSKEARCKRLAAALKPFADAVDEAGDETDYMDADAWEHPLAMAVKVGDFHHAHAALAADQPQQDQDPEST